MTTRKPITISFFLLFFIVSTYSQATVESTLNASLNVENIQTYMVTNGIANSSFIQQNTKFDCSLSYLFTYSQTSQNHQNNTPYTITLSGLSYPTLVQISTVHQNFNITFSPEICEPPNPCNIQVFNNCPQDLNFFNYFDRVIFNLQNYQELSYYVICDQDHPKNTFEWGMIIQIVVITVLLAIIALYSRAWSLGGQGIEINLWLIILFDLALIFGGLIGYYSEKAIDILLNMVTFFLGIIGVSICANELLFLLKLKFLNYSFFKIGGMIQFRMLQAVSIIIGTLVLLGWFYSGHNMIVNDIVCFCMIVGIIKLCKFTSFKIAVIAFTSTILIELVIAFLIYYLLNQSYNSLFLNKYNFPIQLQMPTINAVYDQKCAWLPFTAIIFPGMLFSYLRRFDSSRSTKMYLIIGTFTFFLGGIAWMFVSIVSPVNFPFGLISEPCMFCLIGLFSFRRREIRTLWDGLFYDPQFSNREDIEVAIQMIGTSSRRDSVKTIQSALMEDLKGGNRTDSFKSTDSNVIRSKFMRGLGQQRRETE